MKKITLKGNVIIILSAPPHKDGNARFTTVPLTALSDQVQDWLIGSLVRLVHWLGSSTRTQ